MPIIVAVQSVFAHSNTGIVGLDPTEGTDVYIVWVYSVFMLFCVQVAALLRADPPPPAKESYRLCWSQLVFHSRSEKRLLASRFTPGWQGENSVFDRSRIMAVHSNALWPLQRSGDIREVSGDSPARSHVRFMSCVLGQRDRNWQNIPRAHPQLTKIVWAVPRNPP
jgi:hypothetical protein